MKQVKVCGDLLTEQGKFKEAANVYTQAIKHHKDKADLYYNLGIAYARINEFSLAKDCFTKTVEIDSSLYNAYYRLGQIALLYRDMDSAEQYFTQSLDGEVEIKSYYQLAKIYMMKNNKNKAIIFLNKAIENSKYYYELVKEEPVFFPIKQLIIKPNEENFKKVEETEREKQISEYLDNTYDLTRILNEKENKKNNRFKL